MSTYNYGNHQHTIYLYPPPSETPTNLMRLLHLKYWYINAQSADRRQTDKQTSHTQITTCIEHYC